MMARHQIVERADGSYAHVELPGEPIISPGDWAPHTGPTKKAWESTKQEPDPTLKPYGWAPGLYMGFCKLTGVQFQGSKRSRHCREAAEMLKQAEADLLQRNPWVGRRVKQAEIKRDGLYYEWEASRTEVEEARADLWDAIEAEFRLMWKERYAPETI